jgi:hypothetical protein
LNVAWLVGGIIAGLTLYLPYVFGEMAHGWENTRGMIFGSRGGYHLGVLHVFSSPLSFLVNYWGSRWTFSPTEYQEIGRACFGSFALLVVLNVVSAIVAGLLVIGAFGEARNALRGFWCSARATFARSPGMVFLIISFVVPLMSNLVNGNIFHARYCLVEIAPIFSLTAVSVVRWLSRQRIRQIFLPLLLATLGVNVWLVLTIFRFQGRCIEQGALFVPSFHNLETVYQSLKAHAHKNQPIRVEYDKFQEDKYMRAMAITSHWASSYPYQISVYVAIRECENAPPSTMPSVVLSYEMFSAEQVNLDNPAVAYRKHGLALVAVPARQ